MAGSVHRIPVPVDIDGTCNARIVAWYGDGSPRLIRSAAPDRLTDAGERTLHALGVTRIVDLREPGEESPRSFSGIRTVSVPLYRLPQGAPRTGTLASIYDFMLDNRGEDLARAVGQIADNDTGATLVHCSIGKDRTGLVIALARLCMGATPEEVGADYALTERGLTLSIRNDTLAQIAADAPDEPLHTQTVGMRLTSPASMMATICEHLNREGGAAAYLSTHGLSHTQLDRLAADTRPCRRLTVLHCSDVHATEPGDSLAAADGLSNLASIAGYVRALALHPDLIVCTGDLIHHDFELYPRVAAKLAALANEVGAPLVVVPGNHDDVAEAQRLTGGLVPALPHRTRICGYDVMSLDSSEGSIPEAQLAWLHGAIHAPDALPSVLVMHHSPLPSVMPSLTSIGLRNADALADVIAGADVRLVLAGHYHHAMQGMFHGVPVCVAPSLAYEQDMSAGPSRVSGVKAAAFAVEELDGDGLRTTIVPMEGSRSVLFTVPAGSSTHPGHHLHD